MMGGMLLWIENLAVALLFMALVIASLAKVRTERTLLQRILGIISVVALWATLMSAFAYTARMLNQDPKWTPFPHVSFQWNPIPQLFLCEIGIVVLGWFLCFKVRRFWLRALLSLGFGLLMFGLASESWCMTFQVLLTPCYNSTAEGLNAFLATTTPMIYSAALMALAMIGYGWISANQRWAKITLAIFLACILLFFYTTGVLVAWQLDAIHATSNALLFPLLTIAILYILGVSWLLFRGLRFESNVPFPAAASWNRGYLTAAWLGMTVLHWITFCNLDLAARQQLATMRAEADSMALSQMPPRIPDRENAAVVYRQAFESMGAPGNCPACVRWDNVWIDNGNNSWNMYQNPLEIKAKLNVQDPELQRFLKYQAEAIRLFREAAAMPACDFDRNDSFIDLRGCVPFEYSCLMQEGMYLLALDAIFRASEGDRQVALDNIKAIFQMSEHIGNDPALASISHLPCYDRMAINALQVVLASNQFSSEELEKLKIINDLSYRQWLKRALRVHFAQSVTTLEQACEGRYNTGWEQIENRVFGKVLFKNLLKQCCGSFYRIFFLRDDIQASQHLQDQLTWDFTLPYYQRHEKYPQPAWNTVYQVFASNLLTCWEDTISNFARKSGKETASPSQEGYSRGLLTPLFWMYLDIYGTNTAQEEAQCRTARAGVAAYCYRLKHGKYPEKLEDLTPDFLPFVPLDPFDGKPLRMKQTEDGLVIYSVGSDLVDNDGVPQTQSMKPEKNTDITFELTSKNEPTKKAAH